MAEYEMGLKFSSVSFDKSKKDFFSDIKFTNQCKLRKLNIKFEKIDRYLPKSSRRGGEGGFLSKTLNFCLSGVGRARPEKSSELSSVKEFTIRLRIMGMPECAKDFDGRMAHILAKFKIDANTRFVEVPSNHKKARYLEYLSKVAPDVVKKDYSSLSLKYKINVREALKLIDINRTYRDPRGPDNGLIKDKLLKNNFYFGGHKNTDGSWEIRTSDKQNAKFLYSMVKKLDGYCRTHPNKISQNHLGNYVLSKEAALELGLKNQRNLVIKGNITLKDAKAIATKYQGIEDKIGAKNIVVAKDIKKSGKNPIKADVAKSTMNEYTKLNKRLCKIPLEQRPLYLIGRADEVSRSFWWKEHATIMRQAIGCEQQAKQFGNKQHINAARRIRLSLEAMQYSNYRTKQVTQKGQKYRYTFNEKGYQNLTSHLKEKGDMELHDTLVIARCTGLRPAELAKGVKMEVKHDKVKVIVEGAKKAEGIFGAAKRFKADRGKDRVIEIDIREMSDVASRNRGFFKPDSSVSSLQMRLKRNRENVEGAGEITLYSFRHNFCTEQSAIKTREETADAMGHKSVKSQEAYGALKGR